MWILYNALGAGKGRSGVTEVLTGRGSYEIGTGIQNPGHDSGVCLGSPSWECVAAERLRHVCNRNTVFYAHSLAL